MDLLQNFVNDPLTLKWIKLLLALLLTGLGVRIFNKLMGRFVKGNSMRYSARKVVSFVGILIFTLLAMSIFDYGLTNLALALGVAGAGIAFALQEVIVSIAGFLAILFGNFYKIGDRVQLGGIKGDVVDIGVLRTTLMELGDWVSGDLYNGKMVRVANSFIFKEPVYNYSGDFPFLWDEIKIPLKHHSNISYSKKVLLETMNQIIGDYATDCQLAWHDLTKQLYVENARIEPMVTLSFDENWLTFTLRYVVDFKKRRTVKDELFTAILSAINSSEGKMVIASSAMEITHMNTRSTTET